MKFPIKITENFILEPIMHTFGCRPETSYVDIGEGTLEVAMGRWFHEKMPLSQISQIAPSDWPWWGGLGVKLAHHGVGVVGDSEGIVNIKFKSPIKMHVVVTVDASQLWVSVPDREAFLSALSKATKLPVSAHAPF